MRAKQATNRESLTPNGHIILCDQVDGVCPKCHKSLTRKTNSGYQKSYDIAHIYPLNPKPSELLELANEIKISNDANDLGNLIPLCHGCHEEFDNPRTKEAYREMVKLKKKAEFSSKLKQQWHDGKIEAEIKLILDSLSSTIQDNSNTALTYDPKTIDKKTDKSLSDLSKRLIKLHNTEFYKFIRAKHQELESLHSGITNIIAQQIKLQYTKLIALTTNQQAILEALIDWIHAKVPSSSRDACHITVSFYVQNCEVF